MAFQFVENKEEIGELLSHPSLCAELVLPNDLPSARCVLLDLNRPALAFQVGHGGFSDPCACYMLYLPGLVLEFRVYTNPFSTQYIDIEWNRSCSAHKEREPEINLAIHEVWRCLMAQWGRYEKSSMLVKHQGDLVKLVV